MTRGAGRAGAASHRLRQAMVWGAASWLAWWPAAVLAHAPGRDGLGLWSGLRHPVTGLDHALAMIAVGLWGAQLGPPLLWVLPIAFPVVMALGAVIALLEMTLPGVEVGIALSAIVLGAAVLLESCPRPWVAILLVVVFAVLHGHAHGTELPADANAVLYSIGFVVATGMLHAAGIGIGIVHRWSGGRVALRAAGGLIAGVGLGFLWRTL